ncbi:MULTISPECIES: sulfite exporter TauE/SafE family protein [unclassified Actinopolyspora]|uniref:sulfite exporter TauE/SafE family protein n=1 Tax=unclassified Actinopolyspora TaxID=2639451 RepID=UPI0013F5CAB2|nr:MULTISPECIES: sulfite exporter TauE/SafE family protein [unclassified Actinopolyspora]NHD18133.1 sulfite exporter TauE/SafE family protein [Actinopolyspora sp. BKK2]NHE77190.1 sulfite exporter TauE/SafE family protein [Actinopolyspora sp. BKK1]
MIPAAVFGAVIGLALGSLGGGGAVLAVPALVYGAGLPLRIAIPTSLAVVAVSSLGGLLPRARRTLVRWPIAAVFALTGAPAAFGGTALGQLLPQRWLLLAFAALMAVVALRMLRSGEERGGACRTVEGGIDWRSCLPKSIAAGALVGVLTGLFGVGGGFVVVPALTTLLGIGSRAAVATSLVVVFANSATGLVAHAGAVQLDYGLLGVFAGTALVVSVLAGAFAARLPARLVREWFARVVLTVAAGVALAAVFAPSALGG